MKVDEKTTKLIVIDSFGNIPELGGISGPIINPIKLDLVTISTLITNGHKVFEVNPDNHNERTRLTIRNIRDVIYNVTKPASTTIEAALAAQTPAVSQTQSYSKSKKNNDQKSNQQTTQETLEEVNDFIKK